MAMPPLNDKDMTAKIISYKPMAISIVKKYRSALHTDENYQDLLQEADIAIFNAINDFDPKREKTSSETTYVYNRIQWHLHRVFLSINHSGVRPPYYMSSKDKKGDTDYNNARASSGNIDEMNDTISLSTKSTEDEFISLDNYNKIMEWISSKDDIVKRLIMAYLKLSIETVSAIQREKFPKHKKLCYAIIKSEIEELKDIINDNN